MLVDRIEPVPLTKEMHEELKHDLKTECHFERKDVWKISVDQLEEIRTLLIYTQKFTDEDIKRIKHLFLKGWAGDFREEVIDMTLTEEEQNERTEKIHTLASLVDLD